MSMSNAVSKIQLQAFLLKTLVVIASSTLIAGFIAPATANAVDGTETVTCLGGGSFEVVTSGAIVETRNGSTCSGALTIPEGVTTIGVASFIGSGITSVAFPASVETIDVVAFQAATSLATISFAAGSQLTAINQEAFKLTALTSFPVPALVTTLRYDVADSVSTLTEFVVDPSNTSYMDADGVLYNKTQTQLLKYPQGKAETSFTVPSSVIEIGAAAVRDTGLSSVVFSENSALTTIGPTAFAGNSALTSIKIPEGVTTIGQAAFGSNSALISATIPSTVTAIPQEMFVSNTELRSVVFSPNSQVASIGLLAFENTPLLTDLVLPASITSISESAFLGLHNAERRLYFAGTKPSFGLNVFHTEDTEAPNKRIYVSSATSWEDHVSDNDNWIQGVNLTLGFYTVTFDSNHGTAVAPGVLGARGAISEPIPPTRSGYTFEGWSVEPGGDALTFGYNPVVDEALTLYALWSEVAETDRGLEECTTGTFELVTRGDAVIVENGQTCAGLAVIPAAVTSINPEAFYPGEVEGSVPRTELTQITFAPGSRLENIGERAFRGANLTAIELPETLRIIGQEAFTDVPLTSLSFGENPQLETINEAAFQGTSISSLYLPSSTSGIGATAFSGNARLSNLRFGNGSTPLIIGDDAFAGTPSLVDVVLPARVAAIGSNAFSRTSEEMKNFYFLGSKPAIVGDNVFGGFTEETAKVYVSRDFNAPGFNWFEPYWYGTALNDDGDAIPIADVVLQFYILELVDSSGTLDFERVYGRGSGVFGEDVAPMVEPVAPTRSDYTFAGWAETNNGTLISFPFAPEADSISTLYAVWVAAAEVEAPSAETSTPAPIVTPAPVGTPKPVVTPTPTAVIATATSMTFAPASTVLGRAQLASVKKAVQRAGKNAKFTITGGASIVSNVSVASTRAVARKRAEAVKAYLVKLGVAQASIVIRSKVFLKGQVAKTEIAAKSVKGK